LPDQGYAADPGWLPDQGYAADPGWLPDQGYAADPGWLPDQGYNADPSWLPDLGYSTDQGWLPDQGPLPSYDLSPSLLDAGSHGDPAGQAPGDFEPAPDLDSDVPDTDFGPLQNHQLGGSDSTSFGIPVWCTRLGMDHHQRSIRENLGRVASSNGISIMERMQELVDKEQDAEMQYLHAMRGDPNVSRAEYVERAEAFVRSNLEHARASFAEAATCADHFERMGLERNAYVFLGMAMHTLQDATSPVHRGFQLYPPWNPVPKIGHFLGERHYPPPGSYERQQLDGATWLAWQIAHGRGMPDRLFDDNGYLILPADLTGGGGPFH
jgi:hypothetical protein